MDMFFFLADTDLAAILDLAFYLKDFWVNFGLAISD